MDDHGYNTDLRTSVAARFIHLVSEDGTIPEATAAVLGSLLESGDVTRELVLEALQESQRDPAP